MLITIPVNGSLKSSSSIHIGTPAIHRMWSFTITFMAPEGREVEKGARILGFDTKELQQRLMRKQPELDTAKKELEKIRIEEREKIEDYRLQLAEKLVQREKASRKAEIPGDLISQNEARKAQMDLQLAELEVQLLESQLNNQRIRMSTLVKAKQSLIKRLETEVAFLQESIQKMMVKAPIDGIIVYTPDPWEGKKRQIGDRAWRGMKVMQMPDLKKMEVEVLIPESHSGKVKKGMAAEVRLDSNPDKIYHGRVKSLGRVYRTKSKDQPSIICDAVVSLDESDPKIMRPGMAAKVDIIISSKKAARQIPESAVFYENGSAFVYKKTLSGRKKTRIQIGDRSKGKAEILNGLTPKDRVLITGGKE